MCMQLNFKTPGDSSQGAQEQSKRSRDEEGEASEPVAVIGSSREGTLSNRGTSAKNVEDAIRNIITSQMKASFYYVEDGLVHLLRQCLLNEVGILDCAALSGCVDHFESSHGEDFGWGCGWRNIQIMSSYLLAKDPESREALFNGAGFVPDIPSLQCWLEIAWMKGFDPAGANHFNWQIYGTKKWIGTTECATLLRSFGIRANIVRFTLLGSKRLKNELFAGSGRSSETLLQNEGKDDHGLHAKAGGHTETEPGRQDKDNQEINKQVQLYSEGIQRKKSERKEENQTSDVNENHVQMVSGGSGKGDLGNLLEELIDQVDSLCLYNNSNNNDVGNSLAHPDGPEERYTCSEKSFAKGFRDNNVEKTAVLSDLGEKSGMGDDSWGPTAVHNHHHLVEWVWKYFTGSADQRTIASSCWPVYMSKRSPLYFQHRGHSRTIVGIERRRKLAGCSHQINLLVVDPSQSTQVLIKSLQEKRGWQKLIKHDVQTLKQSEYQICYVDPGVAQGEELEQLKLLASLNYSYH